MILRFVPTATPTERERVRDALRRAGNAAGVDGNVLLLGRPATEEEAVELAAMPGVEEIQKGTGEYPTVAEVWRDWTASAAAVMGLVILLAASFPAPLGAPADPLSTPPDLLPSWPFLPFHATIEALPGWVPSSFVYLIPILLILTWPVIGRRFARNHKALHTGLGLVAVILTVGLALREALG